MFSLLNYMQYMEEVTLINTITTINDILLIIKYYSSHVFFPQLSRFAASICQ